ncbi:hypothetical protein MACK_000363 [Theileria orientalis]|uniref:Uncharacterized protein n=1 Tax=Theileria orientalis TaxID=68886 RepID=A0A976QWH8_THEOR|nr:hypothetical protein MACK_000363 [Theileria orientalis]
MWKSSSKSRVEDENRSRDSKLSHSSKYNYKSNENTRRDHKYGDNYHRHDIRKTSSRQSTYGGESGRESRYHEPRYNTSSADDNSLHKYKKIRHNYSDYESSDRKYEDQSYESRRMGDKYRPQSQRGDYKSSKRSYHSPSSPKQRYSPYKSYEKSSSYRSYDKYRQESISPKTPASEGMTPLHKKFSPPPLPPFEPPVMTPVSDGSLKKGGKFEKTETISTFAQFYESKRSEGKYKEYGADPRLEEHLYGSRIVVNFELVAFPPNPNIDTTLDSPEFTLDIKYDALYTFNAFFQTPLEMINQHLFSQRPKIEDEWDVVTVGDWNSEELWASRRRITTNRSSPEGDGHQRYLLDKHSCLGTLFDEWHTEEEVEDLSLMKVQNNLKNYCRNLGISKFILLFGDSNVAINEIPLMYPRNPDSQEAGEDVEEIKKRFIANDQPEGMGLLVFESEEQALRFWSIMSTNLVQVYPSAMRMCPDPSGWRIYSEALSLSFKTEMLTGVPQPVKSPQNDTLDLLSVLTTPNQSFTQTTSHTNAMYNQSRQNAESPGNKADVKPTKNTMLTYVCSYVSEQEDANQMAKHLTKHGVKCMYHKPSKIMSLQFPDENTLQEITFGRKIYMTHTGSRVQCCFIKCYGKAMPILKRANVEHLSNSHDKKKNAPVKTIRFKPPAQGILNVEELNE